MVVAVLDARTQSTRPRGPHTVSDPALTEGRNPSSTALERVREVEVLHLYRIPTSSYARKYVLVLADGGEGRVILDPAQHVRYTGLDHGAYTSVVMASVVLGGSTGASLSDLYIVSFRHCGVNRYTLKFGQ